MSDLQLLDVPIGDIHPHVNNPRREIGDVVELTASIKAHGILEPLVVAPNGDGYTLIAGHRRLAAAQAAQLAQVPALLRPDLTDPGRQLEAMLIENTQRTDLTPVEEADAYEQLLAFDGYTITKIAKATGRNPKTVKLRLALNRLEEADRAKVHNHQLTLDNAEILAAFAGTPDYGYIARYVGTSNLGWAVQRAKERKTDRAALVEVEAYAVEQGWKIVADRAEVNRLTDGGHSLAYKPHGGTWRKALEPLDGEVVLEVNRETGDWRAWRPADPNNKKKTSVAATNRDDDGWEAEYQAREQRKADIETARQNRITWCQGRVSQLLLKPEERLAVLRLLLTGEEWDFDDRSAELAGMTRTGADDFDAEWSEFINGLHENGLWRAFVAIVFDLGSCGSANWAGSHRTSIRVAQALGYELSDVEVELLAGSI